MRAELSCELAVERFAVFAEMAWLERRPELGLVCRAARANADRITPASVQSVLPGVADAGARNVIDWCAKLGLCDRGGGLTKLGFEVAETDEAPVPEQGVYELWCAEHPLLGRRILAAERLASNRDQRFEQVERLPLEPDRGVVFRSVADPRQRFVLRDLPSNHGQVGGLRFETRAGCRLEWTLDFNAGRDVWRLAGKLEGMRPIEHQSEAAGLDLWALASHWGAGPFAPLGRWQALERRLAVGFTGLTDAEQQEFRKTFTLARADVPGKGSYTDVVVKDVPIGPASDADAQRWGMVRLDRQLRASPAYRSRGRCAVCSPSSPRVPRSSGTRRHCRHTTSSRGGTCRRSRLTCFGQSPPRSISRRAGARPRSSRRCESAPSRSLGPRRSATPSACLTAVDGRCATSSSGCWQAPCRAESCCATGMSAAPRTSPACVCASRRSGNSEWRRSKSGPNPTMPS
ncbi:hypothetical protein [Nannocystis pusilla]|uniref:hypothetical protein n=1 Tax=Nannocystis pusilla TaxID=889268 RepID=UPI003B7D13EE